MDEFDRKVIAAFPGKSVRKDLTVLMKKGANVPTYVKFHNLLIICVNSLAMRKYVQQPSVSGEHETLFAL